MSGERKRVRRAQLGGHRQCEGADDANKADEADEAEDAQDTTNANSKAKGEDKVGNRSEEELEEDAKIGKIIEGAAAWTEL